MRTAIVAITAGALLLAGLIMGVVQPLYDGDGTGLTYAATVVALVGTFAAGLRAWIVEHGITLLLGFLGTVIGFLSSLEGLAADDDVIKLAGVSTALTTTVVGLCCHLYLLVIQRVAQR
jgi:hypothetical protein